MERGSHEIAATMGKHWWYRGREAAVASLVMRSGLLPGSGRVLDYGCGSGHMGRTLSRFGEVCGVDSSPRAIEVGHFQDYAAVAEAGIDEVGERFPGSFKLIACLDVLEHVEDDVGLLRKLASLLEENGLLVASVPMWPELYCSMDEEAGHVRRYSPDTLNRLFEHAGMRPVVTSGYVVALLPLARAHRRRVMSGRSSSQDELKTPPALLNSCLAFIACAEGRLARYLTLPTGLSQIAVLQRVS